MYVGIFGDVIFSVGHLRVLTPSNFKGTTGANWAEHEVLGGKARAEYLSPKLREYTFDILLDAALGVNPRKMLNRLTEMSENGEIHYLIIGFAPVSQNKFRVTEISDSWDSVIKHGLLMQCKVSLTIKEYITVDPQVQALMKLVKAEIEKHNANADAHAATITAAVSAAVKNLSESGEILNEEQVKALIKEQVDGGTGGGYYGSYELTLAADGWKPARSEDDYENAGGMDYYQCIYDAELSDSTSELVPVGVVSPGSFYTTTKAGVLNGCETHDGFIRFFSQRIPSDNIQATVTLFGKGGGSGETGSVSIGQGLKRDASGAIAVRIGEGLDFDSTNALTVRKETVMTSEDLLNEEETQQEIVDMLK